MAACRWCGAPVVFVRMADTGRMMPCNPGPDDRANVARSRINHGGRVVTAADPLDPDTEVGLLAHWATCTAEGAVAARAKPKTEPAQQGLF